MVRARRLRALLAFAMVPVVLLSNPETAAASGPWTQVEISPDIPGMPDEMDCWINLQHAPDGQSLNVGGNSACSGGVDISPGEAQWGEEGSGWTIIVDGATPTGDHCGGNGSGTFGAHSSAGVINVAGSFGAGVIALSATEVTCIVTEVCLVLAPGGAMVDTDKCVTVDLAPPVLDGAECVHGDVVAVQLISNTMPRPGQPAITDYWWDVRVHFTPAENSYLYWRVAKSTSFTSDATTSGTSEDSTTLLFPMIRQSAQTSGTDFGALLQASKPTKLQIYALDQERNTGGTYDPSAHQIATTYPPALPDGAYRGLTQPQLCRFYFGVKLVDIPNTDQDEPSGPLGEEPYDPPPVEEPTVEPPEEVWEPIDTETDFWSLVGGLLRKLLGALGALADAIGRLVSAIGDLVTNLLAGLLDLLLDLFVPDGYVLEGHLDSAQDAWDDTTPMRYVDAVSQMQTGAVSGCGGLPLQLTLPGGVQVDERIGAACSGTMANVASLVRLVVSAALVIGGTFACVRAIGSGLNWNPGIGMGGSA